MRTQTTDEQISAPMIDSRAPRCLTLDPAKLVKAGFKNVNVSQDSDGKVRMYYQVSYDGPMFGDTVAESMSQQIGDDATDKILNAAYDLIERRYAIEILTK